MSHPTPTNKKITSGVSYLDTLLGGLFIGDNVIWYDDAGSLASIFCLKFIQASQTEQKPVIYISFDRSPRNLLDKLGPLAENLNLTILDCFTWGKGAGSDVFLRFYAQPTPERPCEIICVKKPQLVEKVMDELYALVARYDTDVRLVFESITGIQELWGGEEYVTAFYVHACPRLYELNTVAYWVMERNAHSPKARAQINQIAQVVIDLSIKRGSTSLNIIKAENRSGDNLHQQHNYWTRNSEITFENEKKSSGPLDLGLTIKEVRLKRGLSQTELAKKVGVTPSTISQVEGALIYPSLPALVKIAEVLGVEISSLFQGGRSPGKRVVFTAGEASEVKLPDISSDRISVKLLTPVDLLSRTEAYLIEFAGEVKTSAHFFMHKGEEIGHVLAGRIEVTIDKQVYKLEAGDTICLSSDIPSNWANLGPETVRLLWIKVK